MTTAIEMAQKYNSRLAAATAPVRLNQRGELFGHEYAVRSIAEYIADLAAGYRDAAINEEMRAAIREGRLANVSFEYTEPSGRVVDFLPLVADKFGPSSASAACYAMCRKQIESKIRELNAEYVRKYEEFRAECARVLGGIEGTNRL